jgi:hypothetical protein
MQSRIAAYIARSTSFIAFSMANPTLEQRIETLERHNRTLTIALCASALIACILASVGMQQSRPQSFDATEFRLIDEQGKPRARFAMLETGPALIFTDADANSRVKLLLDDADGPALFMSDHNRADRLAIRVEPTGATLAMGDENGAERVRFATSETGASIGLFDAQLKNRARLAIDNTGLPSMHFFTESALPLFALIANEDGLSVALSDMKGHHLWCMPEGSQAEPADTVAEAQDATTIEP